MKGITMSTFVKTLIVLAVAMYLIHILSAGADNIISLEF